MACGNEGKHPRSSLSLSSDIIRDYICAPCEAEGKYLEARGYCENCAELLCDECFKYHTKPSMTRNHSLLEKRKTGEFEEALSRSQRLSATSEISESRSELSPSMSELGSLKIDHILPNSELGTSNGQVTGSRSQMSNSHLKLESDFSSSRSDFKISSMRMKMTETCIEHIDESIKYYCETHENLGCDVCVTTKHRKCDNVSYIPNVSRDIFKRNEYQHFNKNVEVMEAKAKETIKDIGHKIEFSRHSHSLARTSREEFRKEIDDMLDKLLKTSDEQSNALEVEETERMNNIMEGCTVILREIQALSNQLETCRIQNNECALYITLKKAKKKLSLLETFLQTAAMDVAKECVFQPDRQLIQVLTKEGAFGKLESLQRQIPDTRHVKDIRVRTSSDSEECWITGLALMPNHKLIAVDHRNKKVKLVDIKKCKVISWLRLSNPLWDAAKITETTVAATVPVEERIVLITVTKTVKVDSDIKVSGRCHGVTYTDGKLIVSYTDNFPDKIELMDLKGKVIKTISTNENGEWLFWGSKYISTSFSGQTIYVSNWENHTIVCLSPDGSVKSIYKDDTLKTPGKMVLDAKNRMYVTDLDSDKLLYLSASLKKSETLLTGSNRLEGPSCAAYGEETNRLYVGMEIAVIKVFEFL